MSELVAFNRIAASDPELFSTATSIASRTTDGAGLSPLLIEVVLQVILFFVRNCPWDRFIKILRRKGPFGKNLIKLIAYKESLARDSAEYIDEGKLADAVLEYAEGKSDEEIKSFYDKLRNYA